MYTSNLDHDTIKKHIKSILLTFLQNSSLVDHSSILIDGDEIFCTIKYPSILEDFVHSIQIKNQQIIAKLTSELPNYKHYINYVRYKKNQINAKPQRINQFRHIIAILSGKGGVGKSTTAVHLAYCFKQQGLKVGILDGDIYGPSIEFIMGEGTPIAHPNKLPILLKDDIVYTSVSQFLPNKDDAVVLKAPMVNKLFNQLINDASWDPLDILLIDLPPGTGDTIINLLLKYEITGALVVCTPQQLAIIDALKATNMLKTLDITILGMIENMNAFICPNCGNISNIFDKHGFSVQAQKHNIELLGSIPIDLQIRQLMDQHSNIIKELPNNPVSKTINHIATAIIQKLNI